MLLHTLDRGSAEASGCHSLFDSSRLFGVRNTNVTVRGAEELCRDGIGISARKKHIKRPIFRGYKGADLIFTLNDYPSRNRLYTPCTKSAFYVFPKKRTKLISENAVEDTARLLCIHQLFIYGTRLLDCRLDRRLCKAVVFPPSPKGSRHGRGGGKPGV